MLYPSIKKLLTNIENRYLLVNIASKRARDISDEADEAGELLDQKPVKLAINEIADGVLSGSLKDGQVSSAER